MEPASSQASSTVPSDDDTERSFSDTAGYVNDAGRPGSSDSGSSTRGWELDWIEDSKVETKTPEGTRERFYKLKFKGYPAAEWHHQNNVDALELVRCYWEHVHHGREACIRAQQHLLQEIAARSDSEDSEAGRAGPPTRISKHHKRLKPRPGAEADPDLADSGSSSSEDNDGDDEHGAMTVELRDLQLNNPKASQTQIASASSSRFRYIPKDPEVGRLLKLALLQIQPLQPAGGHDSPGSIQETQAADRRRKDFRKLWNSSPWARQIDPLQAVYSYQPASNPERAKRVAKKLEEIQALHFSGVRQTRLKVIYPRQDSTSIIDGRETAMPDDSEPMHGSEITGPDLVTPLTSSNARPAPLPLVAQLSNSATHPQGLNNQASPELAPPPRLPGPLMTLNPNNPPHNARPRPPHQTPKTPRVRCPILGPRERRTDAEEEERFFQSNPRLKRKLIEHHHHPHDNFSLHDSLQSATNTTPKPLSNPFSLVKKACLRKKTVRWA